MKSAVPDEIYPSRRAGCDGATIPEAGGSAKYMAEKSVHVRAPWKLMSPVSGYTLLPLAMSAGAV